ncbi:hypothetical protein ACIBBD_37005 [Streptomyces sp. NPDC051315]|uniref:hypothetical protein n=1 Tax=Streptomyces sp. NPDC051315 TaxID=3365650 RepID=UPI0037A40F9C
MLDRISDKWGSLLGSAPAPGPLRHSDLARRIAGARPKLLVAVKNRSGIHFDEAYAARERCAENPEH